MARRVKQVDLGYWMDKEDMYEFGIPGGDSIEGYIRDMNARALYDDETVDINNVTKAGFTEDGAVVRLADGTYFQFCDRGMMGTRGWIVDDEDEIEEYDDAFGIRKKRASKTGAVTNLKNVKGVSTIDLKNAKKVSANDVKGITLLSIEEAEQIPESIREHESSWWLRSPGSDCCFAAGVFDSGKIKDYGFRVDSYWTGVRPALYISNHNSPSLKNGDIIEVFGRKWYYKDGLALLMGESLTTMSFRDKDWEAKDANDYEKSKVKAFLDQWLAQQMRSVGESFRKAIRKSIKESTNAVKSDKRQKAVLGERCKTKRIRRVAEDIDDDDVFRGFVEEYYCPLKINLIRNDNYDYYEDDDEDDYDYEGIEEVSDVLAVEWRDEIERALEDEHNIKGIDPESMATYQKNPKVKFVRWDVDVIDGRLCGIIRIGLSERLTKDEEDKLVDWIEGQNSDGFGEGFEQRDIDIGDGDVINVSFWNPDRNYFIRRV